MIAERIRRALTSLFYCELACIFFSFSLCYFAFYARLTHEYSMMPYHPKTLIFFFVLVMVMGILAAWAHFHSELRSFVIYNSVSMRTYMRTSLIIQSVIGGSAMTVGFFLFSFWAGGIFIIYTLIFCLAFAPVAKLIIKALTNVYSKPEHRVNILLVGINRRSVRFYYKMRENTCLGINVAGFLDEAKSNALEDGLYLGKPENAEKILKAHGVNLVLFFLPMRTFYDTCNKIVKTAEQLGVLTHSAGNLFERDRQQVRFLNSLTGLSTTISPRLYSDKFSQSSRRARDIAAATLMALATWPLLPPVLLLLLLGRARPLIASCEAVGQCGAPIRLYRFSTQKSPTGNDEDEAAPAIPGARLLRGSRLDLLPRGLNLALGDISLFGPRPLSREEFETLTPDEQTAYEAVKPGMFSG